MTENKFVLQSYFILYLLCFNKKKKYPQKTLLEKLKFQKTANMIIRTTPNKPYCTKGELSTPKSRSTQVEHTKAIVCKNVNTSYTTIFFNNTFVHEQKNWKYAKRKLYLCLS
jgi:hypothetical protein